MCLHGFAAYEWGVVWARVQVLPDRARTSGGRDDAYGGICLPVDQNLMYSAAGLSCESTLRDVRRDSA
jgi:hypothetical protein